MNKSTKSKTKLNGMRKGASGSCRHSSLSKKRFSSQSWATPSNLLTSNLKTKKFNSPTVGILTIPSLTMEMQRITPGGQMALNKNQGPNKQELQNSSSNSSTITAALISTQWINSLKGAGMSSSSTPILTKKVPE
jgi:hypothetical protein